MPATARDIFSDQFEPFNGDYLYRRRHKDAPIKITRAELDLFMDRFDRAQPIMTWGGAVAGLVLLAPVTMVAFFVPDQLREWCLLAICCGFAGLVLLASNWIWDAPARALKDRPPCGPAFSPTKARRLAYARMSYASVAFGIGLCALAPLLIPAGREPALLTASAGMIVFLLVHIMRKWSADRARD